MSTRDLEPTFTLLVYVPPGQEKVEKSLFRDVQATIPRRVIEICRYFDDFKKRLCVPLAADAVALLFPIDRTDLMNLVALSEFLNGIPVFIVLPDQNPDMAALAHRLRPRFLTFTEDSLTDLFSVIRKRFGSR